MEWRQLVPLLIKKIIENKLEAALLSVTSCLIGISFWLQSHVEAYIAKVFPTPDISLVAILIELILLLCLIMAEAYLIFHKKYVNKKPNFSKVTEIQKQILKHLESTRHAEDIASKINKNEHFVIRQLELLESYLLVSHSTVQGWTWYLNKHGRAYLYP